MWLLELILFVTTLGIVWILFGYFVLIWFAGLIRKSPAQEVPEFWPKISVIVPCFNEEEQILEKLNNIRETDYPPERLEVLFVDGGSSDKTVQLLADQIGPDEPYRVVQAPENGKINQINHVLPLLSGEIVVNTDADAIMEPDALKRLIAEFANRDDVWVAGAYVRPINALELDAYHWDAQNKGRYLETDFWNSSIVLAPCYAFRRELLETFPRDVVADDVYIALLASVAGHRVVFSRLAKVFEKRGPQTTNEFLAHKFRKSNAYLREVLRFLYLLPQMNPQTRFIVIGRINQQLVLPWALILWSLLLGAMLTIFRTDLVILSLLFVFGWGVFTSLIFSRVNLPDEPRRFSWDIILKGYLITMFILLVTGLSYPWFGQGSSYSRLNPNSSGTRE